MIATCEHFCSLAEQQSRRAVDNPWRFMVGAMLAGGFVGAAMILALSVGSHLDVSVRPAAMGAVFGLSILLVLFGGGELFNGQAMIATLGVMHGGVRPLAAGRLLLMSWTGNVLGAAAVALLFALGGGGQVFKTTLLHDLTVFKGHAPLLALAARAVFCNWLACLGIWTAQRLKSEGAKVIVLAWCVMAYVACGLEHCIANAALFSLDLFSPQPAVDVGSLALSLVVASLGNLVGGAVFVAGTYSLYARAEADEPAVVSGPQAVDGEDFRPTPSPVVALRGQLATAVKRW